MASFYIYFFFLSTIYLTVTSFLHVSPLSSHQRIICDIRSLSESLSDYDNESYQHSDDLPHNRRDEKVRIEKVRIRSRVAYCGTPFCGWQLQPHRTTIQGEIEEALYRRYRRRIAVVGAGRTDAGVHARGQAIHFDLFQEEVPFPSVIVRNATASKRYDISAEFCNELQYSMNRMLRPEIRLFRLQLAPYVMTSKGQTSQDESDDEEQQALLPRLRPWHAIQSSTSKWYSYRFTLGPTLLDPMERFTRTHFHRPSFAPSSGPPYALTADDISRLKSILDLYVGTHDFKAFGGQLEQTEKRAKRKINTIRTIHKVELVNESLKESPFGFIGEEGNYRIDFLIEGALYKMIRNMVGTAIQVWLGNMEERQLIELLQIDHDPSGDDETKSRKSNPCKPAPPEGLTLECVYYDDLF